jgi:hypothetical protein
MLLRLFDTTLPSAAPSNHDHTDDANLRLSILTVLSDWITQGGGAQDLLDNADICRELRHFLHNDEKHAVPEGVSKASVDRPAWEEVQDLRNSFVISFERLIRRPSLSALIVHEPGPPERAYGPILRISTTSTWRILLAAWTLLEQQPSVMFNLR